MKKIIKYTVIFFSLLILAGALFIWRYGKNFNIYLIPPTPKEYGEIALKKMDELGLYTSTEEWQKQKSETLKKINQAKTINDTIQPLEEALLVAGGKHSSISDESNQKDDSKSVNPTASTQDDVLLLTVPEFSGNIKQGTEYAKFLSEKLYETTYKGIILDFRNNRGGDMGPMITGLAPILTDGKLIEFINKKNEATAVTLEDGLVKNAGTTISIDNKRKIKELPIAILINEWTGSSGEISVLCFANNKNVKTFGEPSAGYTTANKQVVLYDGKVMQVTSEKIKDSNGDIYENDKIMPDIETNEPVEQASQWLLNGINR